MTEPLRRLWDDQAQAWAAWARPPDHDSFWHFTRWRLFEILPEPGVLTLDLGGGEGRLARELTARGHWVVGIDGSETLAHLAVTHDEATPAAVGDLAALPIGAEAADLAVACMSLQDVDDLDGVIREAARVLRPGGRLGLAIVHPINSAGRFANDGAGAPFVIDGSYLSEFRYSDHLERDGLAMTFHSMHRPLEAYAGARRRRGPPDRDDPRARVGQPSRRVTVHRLGSHPGLLLHSRPEAAVSAPVRHSAHPLPRQRRTKQHRRRS